MKENWQLCAQLLMANIILNFGHIRYIHPGAVETLFLMLSFLSDIPRSHLKSTRHDKKKQRGKSRQRATAADGTMYVELSVHTGVFFSFLCSSVTSLRLMSVSVWKFELEKKLERIFFFLQPQHSRSLSPPLPPPHAHECTCMHKHYNKQSYLLLFVGSYSLYTLWF